MHEQMNVLASEIGTVQTGGGKVNIPLFDRHTGTATIVQVDLEGHQFTALAVENSSNQCVDQLIDLATGTIYTLLPPAPYSDEEQETANMKVILEDTFSK